MQVGLNLKNKTVIISGIGLFIAGYLWYLVFDLYRHKTTFFDDAFIYLHMAANVVEAGTAQYFPISGNQGLLASSPLRLIILVLSTCVVNLITGGGRSLEAARLVFYFSGIITSFIYLPLFGSKFYVWIGGFIFSALLALSTGTALQMEGLLLFWNLLALITIYIEDLAKNQTSYVKSSILISLLTLTRPEYGLPLLVLYGAMVLYQNKHQFWTRFVVPALCCGLAWCALAYFVLRVYPIPTSYLVKVVHGELRMFAKQFHEVFPVWFNHAFFGDRNYGNWTIFAVLSFLISTLTLINKKLFVGIASYLSLVALVIRAGPGNYAWYYENIFVVFLTIACAVLTTTRINAKQIAVAAVWLVFTCSFFLTYLRERPVLPWDFADPRSAGPVYQYVGKHYVGNGKFLFDGLPAMRIRMCEIGIVSYFAGPRAWLGDICGLAQAGTLEPAKKSSLRFFYPKSVLPGHDDERRACFQTSEGVEYNTVWWAADVEFGRKHCKRYLEAHAVCIND